MGAELVHHADAALPYRETRSALAEEFHPHRRTIGSGFPTTVAPESITPHQPAHRRAGAGEREEVVLLALWSWFLVYIIRGAAALLRVKSESPEPPHLSLSPLGEGQGEGARNLAV